MASATPALEHSEHPVFHLSHTDLDGYGAQYMIQEAGLRARFFNADYHEIPRAIGRLMEAVERQAGEATVLVTDLNLTPEQAADLERRVEALGPRVHLQLLDHHGSGREAAERFDWYFLDTEKCATLLTFEACAHLMDARHRERMEQRARFIDVGDRWLKDSEDFTRAIFLIGLVMENDHLAPTLTDLKRAYRFNLIDGFFDRMEEGLTLEALERSLYDIRKGFLKGRVEKRIFNDAELPLKDKYHRMSAELLDLDDVPLLEIDGHRAGLFFNWPHDVFRGVIMELMERQGRMDMAILVRGNGRMSLRANPGTDVSRIAAEYFSGGGHPGAAGGTLGDVRLKNLKHAVNVIREATGGQRIKTG